MTRTCWRRREAKAIFSCNAKARSLFDGFTIASVIIKILSSARIDYDMIVIMLGNVNVNNYVLEKKSCTIVVKFFILTDLPLSSLLDLSV